MICPTPLDYQVLALGVRLSWLGAPSCVLKLCALLLGVGVGRLNPGPTQALPPPPLPRKKHWSASWTVLEGGVLTFFKDSKNSAAGGLVRPRPPGQGPPHLLLTPEGLCLIRFAKG